MKIRALASGEIINVGDDTALQLIDAGIYEAADAAWKPKRRPKPPEQPAPKQPDKSTKVEPLTTEDMPTQPVKQPK